MTDFYSLKNYPDGPHMVSDPKGKWAWASDLAAVRTEIERLTKERDEARAQVASAYGAAERTLEARKNGAPSDREEYAFDAALDRGIVAIRRLTPADAKAAFEAYGRKKVREGMQRAAEVARECWNDPPCEADAKYIPNAILAEMEKLK